MTYKFKYGQVIRVVDSEDPFLSGAEGVVIAVFESNFAKKVSYKVKLHPEDPVIYVFWEVQLEAR